jgi:hypothetical protein
VSDPTAVWRGRRPLSSRGVILATGFGIMGLASGVNMSFCVCLAPPDALLSAAVAASRPGTVDHVMTHVVLPFFHGCRFGSAGGAS